MCEQILKKRQRPNTIQILWIVKNQEKADNRPSYRSAAINNSHNYRCAAINNDSTNQLTPNWAHFIPRAINCPNRKRFAPTLHYSTGAGKMHHFIAIN